MSDKLGGLWLQERSCKRLNDLNIRLAGRNQNDHLLWLLL